MASKMTFVFLISVTVALLVVSYLLLRQEKNEGFQSGYSVKNLEINTCPVFTQEIQTAKGSTDCCQGDSVDGKCNGTTFCTKSPAYEGVLSCVDKWREYFQQKSDSFCPSTMKNYYEDVTNSAAPKGCSAGPISEDGKMPKETTAQQCKLYTSEGDNKTKLDSCYVEKLRAKIQCPVVNGQSPVAKLYTDYRDDTKYLAITCDYPFEIGMPTQCFEKASVERALDSINPNWRTSSNQVEWVNTHNCDNYIARRESSRQEASRLQAEQKAREEAEAARKKEEEARRAAEELAKKREEEASRLQQQLEEANRRLQNCPK